MFNNQSSRRRIPKPLKFLFFLGMAALFIFVLGNVIVFLWNEILVDLTGFKAIQFWEAIGLFVLTRILFGGFRFGSRARAWKNKNKRHWRNKWMNMNEEERAEFKEKWRARCANKSSDEK